MKYLGQWRFLSCIGILSLSLLACSGDQTSVYQGYAENKLRYISTNYSGLLQKLNVEEGHLVKVGDPLFTLEPYPEQMNIDELNANIQAQESKRDEIAKRMEFLSQKLERRKQLFQKKFFEAEGLDAANLDYASIKNQLDTTNANLASLKAQLQKVKWMRGKKSVFAPVEGTVFEIFYRQGELVAAERPVLSLAIPMDTTVNFFVPEQKISQIKIGENVVVNCSGCKPITAKVSYISTDPEITPPTIYSQQTSSKMVFLVKAIPNKNQAALLHPGQPLSVSINK